MIDDPLLYLARAPAFVERVLRRALRDMFAVRREFDVACDGRSFVKIALLAARAPDRTVDDGDILTRYESEAAVVRAATMFAASPLGRRLRSIAIVRTIPAPAGFDLAVLDRSRHAHYVRLESYAGPQARLDAVARAVRAMDRARVGERATIHFFSLRDGALRSYAPAARRHGSGITSGTSIGAAA